MLLVLRTRQHGNELTPDSAPLESVRVAAYRLVLTLLYLERAAFANLALTCDSSIRLVVHPAV